MKNSDYWAQRFRLLNDALQDKSYAYTKNLETQYNSAIADIDTQMRAWYQRFANNNAMSYADAQKLLTSGQLKEFKWTVEEYIKKAQESAINGAWVKELENASARVHISRLEALKLQLRQQTEMLTGGRAKLTHDAAQQAYINGYYRTAYEVQLGLGYGWSMQALNTNALEKVLSRPWTVDDRTFTARCWTDKNKLVQTVNNELTKMLATGAPPDKAIEAIVNQFGVSRYNAGRLIMTESAHFGVLAQHDSFNDLDVEEYKIVETFDKYTCALCGALDGKHFRMSEFAAGENAPPFHPWCRGCIAPYFADMEDVGQRYSRNPDTGKREMLPANTTYEQWAAKYIKKPLKNAAGNVIINTSTKIQRDYNCDLAKQYGKAYYDEIMDIADNCPNEDVKHLWENQMGALAVGNPNYKGRAYCGGGPGKNAKLYVDTGIDTKGTTIHTPHQTFFHESGHAIDTIMRDHNAIGNWYGISQNYNSGEFVKTIKQEVDALVDTEAKRLKAEFAKYGTNPEWLHDNGFVSDWTYAFFKTNGSWVGGQPKYSKSAAYTTVQNKIIKSHSLLARGDLSDMLEGATKARIQCGVGHGKSYWKADETLATEAFAEMFSATMANTESLEVIKQYLPNSYNVFLDIVKHINN